MGSLQNTNSARVTHFTPQSPNALAPAVMYLWVRHSRIEIVRLASARGGHGDQLVGSRPISAQRVLRARFFVQQFPSGDLAAFKVIHPSPAPRTEKRPPSRSLFEMQTGRHAEAASFIAANHGSANMKRNIARMTLVILPFSLLVSSGAHAECTLATLQGPYGFHHHGFQQGGQQLFASAGIVTFDGVGGSEVRLVTSRDGVITHGTPFTARYRVNPDCTAIIDGRNRRLGHRRRSGTAYRNGDTQHRRSVCQATR